MKNDGFQESITELFNRISFFAYHCPSFKSLEITEYCAHENPKSKDKKGNWGNLKPVCNNCGDISHYFDPDNEYNFPPPSLLNC